VTDEEAVDLILTVYKEKGPFGTAAQILVREML
jgi:hypothetical protein